MFCGFLGFTSLSLDSPLRNDDNRVDSKLSTLQSGGFVAVGVTFDVDGHGEGGDVAGGGFDHYTEGGRIAAEALRADV
jgi:hypothetical protein